MVCIPGELLHSFVWDSESILAGKEDAKMGEDG